MISPDEIKKQALRWWEPLLKSTFSEMPFFPRKIDRVGKIKSGDIVKNFEMLQRQVEMLYKKDKHHSGAGYQVLIKESRFRRTGIHELPDAILFETLEDYLSFTGKRREWAVFMKHKTLIEKTLPILSGWAKDHCLWLTRYEVDWVSVLLVCNYFIENPRPLLYIRQLPIEIHTKFLEENATLMQSLLDFLIPEDIRNPEEKRLAKRYYLKYDEPLVRIRILDPRINLINGLPKAGPESVPAIFADISLPLSDFNRLQLPVRQILITENKMNFLALPNLPTAIAIWSGGGFNVSHLKEIAWLKRKEIFYWGDIDEHGFQILHQLRSYYPLAKSVMMDHNTFGKFPEHTATGARNKAESLPLLSIEERELYNLLKSNVKNRLEQEKIPQSYANDYLQRMLGAKRDESV